HTRSYGDWSSDVCSSALLEPEPEERGDHEDRHDGESEADPGIERDGEVRSQHVEDAVGDVHDALQPEDDGEPGGEQDVDGADRQAIQHLEDGRHAPTPSRRASSSWSCRRSSVLLACVTRPFSSTYARSATAN